MANVYSVFNVCDEEEETHGNGNENDFPMKDVSVSDVTIDDVVFDDVPLDSVTGKNSTAGCPFTKSATKSDENLVEVESANDKQADQLSWSKRFRMLVYNRRGLLFAVISALCFSIEGALMEALANTVDVFQTSCMVSSFTVAFSAVALVSGRIAPPNRKIDLFLLLISGVMLSLYLPSMLLSLTYMELGATVSIVYTMPIFTGIFGWIILKEAMQVIDLLFVILSFGGVLLISQPPFIFGESKNDSKEDENLLLGTTFALSAAVAVSLLIVISRKQTEMGLHLFVLLFSNALVTSFVNAMICTFTNAWKMPSGVEWAEIFGFSVMDFAAQMFSILAVMYEVAFLVSIGNTSEVIFAFIWQIFIFRVLSDWQTGVGAVLIVSSCVGVALKSSKNDISETD